MASTRKVRNLDDLAERAGVTAATVSMALRNSPLLSEKMRERICRLAEESGFKPRTYRRRALPKETAEDGENGPLLVLYYEFPGEPDPVREGIMPALFLMLNERRIEYRYISCQELMADPSIAKDYRGILFYNDPEDFVLPPDIPAAQVFGWEPMREGQDRVTTNDSLVVRLAVDHLCKTGIERAAIVWCREMVAIPDHPRITGFLEAMRERNIEVEALPFHKNGGDFLPMLKTYLAAGSDRIGFFAFNAFCGLKLCCALDSLELMSKYGNSGLVVCDNSPLLYSFSPRPVMIDLNLPQMAEFALEALLRRLKRPELPGTVLLQSPVLISFNSSEPVQRG
ncbi:LacI family DNA-binding transcriptional regulator [uncultured Victivallis sp.]|uniref:LacI family DNA-binding transcriptional regulator n=1 Tax=uncultured Victivallis sp. TaxID=354118 RepID=UPI002593C75B|nr:LacI family DNA-binding transcriptional regulator [uncultured Victivallis sp.]